MVFHRYYCSIKKGYYTILKKQSPGNFTRQAKLLAKTKQCLTYFSLSLSLVLTRNFFLHTCFSLSLSLSKALSAK